MTLSSVTHTDNQFDNSNLIVLRHFSSLATQHVETILNSRRYLLYTLGHSNLITKDNLREKYDTVVGNDMNSPLSIKGYIQAKDICAKIASILLQNEDFSNIDLVVSPYRRSKESGFFLARELLRRSKSIDLKDLYNLFRKDRPFSLNLPSGQILHTRTDPLLRERDMGDNYYDFLNRSSGLAGDLLEHAKRDWYYGHNSDMESMEDVGVRVSALLDKVNPNNKTLRIGHGLLISKLIADALDGSYETFKDICENDYPKVGSISTFIQKDDRFKIVNYNGSL